MVFIGLVVSALVAAIFVAFRVGYGRGFLDGRRAAAREIYQACKRRGWVR